MFYPIQIPTILDPVFKKYISYEEFHYEEMSDYIMCIWAMHVENLDEHEPVYNTILPDGCIDLIFDFTTQTIGFASTYKATVKQKIDTPFDFIGIRFRPGSFYALYHFPSNAIIDTFTPYTVIEKDIPLEDIFTCTTIEQRIIFIQQYLIKKNTPSTERRWIDLVNQIYDTNIEDYLTIFKNELKYSDKTITRLFKRHYGFPPKAFLNILRLHKSLATLLLGQPTDFTDIAHATDFYDQPHFNHEIKKYCGITPKQLLDKYK